MTSWRTSSTATNSNS